LSVLVSRVVAAAAALSAVAAVAWSYGITHERPAPPEPIFGQAGKTIAYIGARSADAAWWPLIVLAAIAGCVICAAAASSARRSLRTAEDIAESNEGVVAPA
jgi:hypothetical protein